MSNPAARVQYLIELMRESLAAFSEGRVALPQLVSDVQSLINTLEPLADPEWVEEMRSHWWKLEFFYAISLDERRPLTNEESKEVADAVDVLQAMLVPY